MKDFEFHKLHCILDFLQERMVICQALWGSPYSLDSRYQRSSHTQKVRATYHILTTITFFSYFIINSIWWTFLTLMQCILLLSIPYYFSKTHSSFPTSNLCLILFFFSSIKYNFFFTYILRCVDFNWGVINITVTFN